MAEQVNNIEENDDIEILNLDEGNVTSAKNENVQVPSTSKRVRRKDLKKKAENINEGKSDTKKTSKNIIKQKVDEVTSVMNGKEKNSNENKNDSKGNSEGKNSVHPPINEMVLDSLRNLKKRNGASAEDISKYVEENYEVNINKIKPYIKKFLQKGVSDGLLDQASGNGADGKFKIKKVQKVITDAGKKAKKSTANVKKAGKAMEKMKKETGKVRKVTGKSKKDESVRGRKRLSTRKNVK